MEEKQPESTSKKQKRLGPAPIASVEDIGSSDEVRQKMESGGSGEGRLPEIQEHPTTASGPKGPPTTSKIAGGSNLGVHASHPTPRIDISRASSSSHQDSRDSSPENVFEQIGTGTLQECAPIGLGFGEEGALELRSSTEELYFMEPEKGMTEREKPSQQGAQSPIIFKFDEQQQACLQQNQRKDSASSEVAALLCISGRTSRISSVGSQGSAASRLSAISGVSRSPSPHRMLLETSFCGPKPLDGPIEGGTLMSAEPPTVETLEQIILARKQDPTQAVLAEGIKIDLSTPKKSTDAKSNGAIIESTAKRKEPLKTAAGGSVIRGALAKKTAAAFGRREPPKAILGVTKSGTEYIRIKLKPDHLYEDHGLAANETVINAPLSEVLKKPLSLSLKSQDTKQTDEISRHPEQKTLASPKPARHTALARDSGSRSPSPATVTISRKSSFCSLFKAKDTTGSPESPTGIQRKKSKEPDDATTPSRARSKSGDRGTAQITVTPSKQKSVLAIFKPRRSGSKSKSTSPVEPDVAAEIEMTNVEFQFQSPSQPPRPKSRLRYYDTPLDGNTIHIPLHTPPEEKDDFRTLPPPNLTSTFASAKKPLQESIHHAPLPEKKKDIEKPQRIEYPDGSIRIPLHSPNEDKERESLWSVEAQRHSSQESQETVISTQITLEKPRKASKPSLTETEPLAIVENGSVVGAEMRPAPSAPPPTPAFPTTTPREKKHIVFTTKIGSGSEEQLFCTQFSLSKTESLSSQLSEQVSQIESPKDAPTGPPSKADSMKREETPPRLVTMRRAKDSSEESRRKSKSSSQSTESIKEEPIATQCSVTVQMPQQSKLREEAINTHRHSRYIENIDQIMEEQRKIHIAMQQSKKLDPQIEEDPIKSHTESPRSLSKPSSAEEQAKEEVSREDKMKKESKSEDCMKKQPSPRLDSSQRGSSESDREDPTDATDVRGKHHLARSMAEDHESAGLVSQESYDDELPYVPTTLPEERSMGVLIIPSKERAHMELRMCPVERPRSTTPINPSCLEEYCGTPGPETPEPPTPKLRISLPRRDSRGEMRGSKSKSPRRISTPSGKSWFEFAEQGIKGAAGDTSRRSSGQPDDDIPPPPLPPRKAQAPNQWINFENIPEKRKPPKRITTLPSAKDPRSSTPPHQVHYNYVNPEECQCECHESERDVGSVPRPPESEEEEQAPPEDTQPLLDEGEPGEAEGISDPSMERLLSSSRSSGREKPYSRK